MRILTVVGARPQFVKAAAISRAISRLAATGGAGALHEEIVHTGQHYDHGMSRVFFDELGLPEPVVNLGIGSASHGAMTARMLEALEREMLAREPDWVLVYGDTNSTLAGALAAVKLRIPLAHVEAGLRSFRRDMAEEVNRVLTDHMAELLFCPTRSAMRNLEREGITRGAHHVGDVMYDVALHYGALARQQSRVLDRLGLTEGGYHLATIHRAENTDVPERLGALLGALAVVSRERPVILPVHPRTRAAISQLEAVVGGPALRLMDPVSYLDMVRLEQSAMTIITDSGGVQKEAYFHRVPCITIRDETEWTETVEAGWNTVVGADPDRIVAAVHAAQPGTVIHDYGTGLAADEVVRLLLPTLA